METYIFDAVRTPRGKGHPQKGALAQIKPIELLSQLYTALEKRNGLDSKELDSLMLGCVGQYGDQGSNLAKISAIYHGWNDNIDAFTVNTFCASGLTAIGLAHAKIAAGMNELVLAGGVEMMSRVPMFADKGAWFADKEVADKGLFLHMGCSADLINNLEQFSREELDAYAVQSHQRATKASKEKRFEASLIPVKDKEGEVVLAHDECIRANNTTKSLQRFEPIFEQHMPPSIPPKVAQLYPEIQEIKHYHHVGNSPQMADGASLLLLGSLEKGRSLGLKPKAKIRAFDSTACEPIMMLLGGQLSMEKAVKKASLTMQEIDLHNFAEAFSVTCLKYQRDFDIDPDKFNVNGGTMSMGHAQGASGAMITTTLLTELERQDLQFGVAGISGGAGLGAGILIERV